MNNFLLLTHLHSGIITQHPGRQIFRHSKYKNLHDPLENRYAGEFYGYGTIRSEIGMRENFASTA